MARIKLSLQPSEAAVSQSAARIYAAYISAGRVQEGHEEHWMKRSVREAIWIARVTDDVQEGVIVATLGYWRSLNRSDGSVNSISSDAFCSLGRAPTFSDNLVQVVRVN